MYTTNYLPLINHPVGKAAFAILLLLCGLLALMMLNHVRLYQGFPPFEFFLPPFITLILMTYNEKLSTSPGEALLTRSFLGIKLKSRRFASVALEEDRKYSTFVFHSPSGRYVSNIVLPTEHAKRKLQIIFAILHKPV